MLFQRQRCLRLMFVCALVSVLLLVARQTAHLGGSYARSLDDYFGRLRLASSETAKPKNSNSSDRDDHNTSASATTAATMATAAVVDLPTGWRHVPDANGSFRMTYPRLYRRLKLLPDDAWPSVNFTAAIHRRQQQHAMPAAANSSTTAQAEAACQRPKSLNVATKELAKQQLSQQPPAQAVSRGSGGFWLPQNCWPPLSITAVIVPYRNRSDNLDTSVPYVHSLLRRQNIAFALFVVEQVNAQLFNRAKLINIGFKVSQRFHAFDCFVFLDADKVPENVAGVFDCANAPKLLISEMRGQTATKYIKGQLYGNFFGGAVAITREAFAKTNGNSNRYYGWGREDDELAARLSIVGYRIHSSRGVESRFVNLGHSNDIVVNKMPWPFGHKVRQTMASDGLNSLKFRPAGVYLHPQFVLIRADV